MKLFYIFFSALILLFVLSCTKDVGPNPDLLPKQNFCDTISFAKHIKPIIEARCTSCHTPGGFAGTYGDYTTDTYAGIKQKVDNGSFRGRVIDLTITPTMPYQMAPLPADTIAILKCWLESGAPNN
jgi:hypothetical protein